MTGFPRTARLLKPDQFKRVFEQGRREQLEGWQATVRYNEGGGARLGMAIARKAVRSAVQRNRIKRRLRESFRRRLGDLADCDIVLTVRPQVLKATPEQSQEQLERLWTRIAQRWPKRSSP